MPRAIAFLSLVLTLLSCSQPPLVAPPDLPIRLHINPITEIAKNPNTHLAVLSDSTVLYVQESESGNDICYAVSAGNSPTVTHLSSREILAAMGFSSGTGTIQGLCESGGSVYFYFCGQSGKQLAACIGKYLPATGEISIVADTQKLRDVSGAGDSLSVCHGSIASAGNLIWVFIRGLDQSVFLQFDPTDGVVHRNFTQLTCDIMPITLDHDAYSIGGNADGSLAVVDLYLAAAWRINPDGQLILQKSLIGLPANIATPSTDDQGRIVLFVSAGDAVTPRLESTESQRITATRFPALIQIGPGQVTVYAGDEIVAGDLKLDGINIGEMTPALDHKSWVGFDTGTGEMYRIRLVQGQ